jgi:hypothetical protein
MNGQSRKHSFVESWVNVAIGYGVALASQLAILPHYGVVITLTDNIEIGGWFTLISVVRSYTIRRFFNRRLINGSS